MKALLLIVIALAAPSLAQDVTHPMEMGLPESHFERPDPADYQLSLENGLVAYIAEAHHVPLVTLSAFVRAGKVSDKSQGAAEALQATLQAAGPAGVQDFSGTLRRMTADYSVDLHDEWMEVSLNVPVEDLDEALPLFAGLLREPAISKASIEGAARSAAPAQSDLGGESGTALYEGSMTTAVSRFYDVLYDGHSYGSKPTAKDFDELRVRDVKDFHSRYFVPGNMTIAVAGAIDSEDINQRLVRLLGDWPSSDVPAPVTTPPVKNRPVALHHVPSNKLQSWLVIGHDLPVIPEDEQAAFDVMAYILGAYHLNTRLMVETRYKYGYTNDASGFADPRWFGPGAYTFRSYSRPEVIENIYRNMMAEIERIREEPVTDRELFVARGALADGSFPIRYVDGYAITRSFALERLRYGHHDRSARYRENVQEVSKDNVLNAARKYLRPERLQVVLVGEEVFEL